MKSITFVTTPKKLAQSSRFIVSTAIGFKDLGWNINWIGCLPASIDLAYNMGKNKGYKKLQISRLSFDQATIVNSDIVFIDTIRFYLCNEQELLYEYSDIFNRLSIGNKLFIHDSGDRTNKSVEDWESDEFAMSTRHKAYTSREPPTQSYCSQFCGMSVHQELNFNLDKQYYITSILNSNHKSGSYRTNLSTKLLKTNYSKYISMDYNLPYKGYIKKLNQSKIGISAWGNGYVCFRDFEILSSNCILAYRPSSKTYLHKLKDMESCITYQDDDELLEKIRYLHDKYYEIQRILDTQNEVVENNYLPHHRALEVIKLMEIS